METPFLHLHIMTSSLEVKVLCYVLHIFLLGIKKKNTKTITTHKNYTHHLMEAPANRNCILLAFYIHYFYFIQKSIMENATRGTNDT